MHYAPCHPTPHQMREFYRKSVHMLFGLGIAALIFATPKAVALSVLMLGTFIGILFTDAILRGYRLPVISGLIDNLERRDALPGRGALTFAVSSLFCVIFFETPVVVPAIITLAVLDGTATIIGYYFGRIKVINGKTIEGSLAGMALCFLVLLPFLPAVVAVLVVFLAGMVELFSPLDDNLLIPVSVCIFLTLLGLG
jgi:phytol kinase